ncbi:MAG: carboxypeptidase regulatory-like domain-containing protein, partial [Desulfobacterales bacterium]|nr:carboxypeptidase regulatory-like domain-containing protein [Desulfobacterales bacterium]
MAVGEEKEISVSFSPTTVVPEGIHTFYLRVESANHATRDIGLYVSVTQSGVGNVLFKVSDIYTGTLDGEGSPIQGLAGAKIRVQNETVLTEEYTGTTDSAGEMVFSDLPTGRYRYRITGKNHEQATGRFWIKPSITTPLDIFMNYNLVSVEWSVTETTIEDKYEIVLNAVYETDAPAAVVIAEPMSVTLPDMRTGDVFNGEFTLTNHGLLRADNLTISPPSNSTHFMYELLAGIPDSIEAKQRITIPYRVTCLQSLEPDEDAGGGGCKSRRECFIFGYAQK